jgi:hypothetical protein
MVQEFSPIQMEVVTKYQGGEFSMITPRDDLDELGDGLFTFVVHEAGEAADREEYISMLRTAIADLEGLLEAIDETDPTSRAIIPLADRYAREVLDDKGSVVCLEVCGVRYIGEGKDIEVEVDVIHPDFHSVYARIRNKAGDALAHCIGDFASVESAREYALHVAKWGNPPWEVHEMVVDGWIPLGVVEE